MSALEPIVLIGAPVRNRAWILPAFLRALSTLKYPRELLQFAFVLNDCTDDTELIFRQWAPAAVRLVRMDFGPAASVSEQRGRYRIEHLARLRNRLLEEFLASDAEYFLSVDTDILLGPGDLMQLLTDRRDLVAGLIRNDGHMAQRPVPYYNILRWTGSGPGDCAHIHQLPEAPLFEVGVSGAVILIHRPVIEAGVRYRATPVGEDAGFCRAAHAAGFSIWCDQRVRPEHVMVKEAIPS